MSKATRLLALDWRHAFLLKTSQNAKISNADALGLECFSPSLPFFFTLIEECWGGKKSGMEASSVTSRFYYRPELCVYFDVCYNLVKLCALMSKDPRAGF